MYLTNYCCKGLFNYYGSPLSMAGGSFLRDISHFDELFYFTKIPSVYCKTKCCLLKISSVLAIAWIKGIWNLCCGNSLQIWPITH